MTDIHCHILPDADDGARSVEDALRMAEQAAASGVAAIVATPHCGYPGMDENFASGALDRKFAALEDALRQAGIPLRLYPGAEVLCAPKTPELFREGKLQTLANSRYLLVEFYFDAPAEFMEDTLFRLSEAGAVPVVAHPERYAAVQNHRLLLAGWFDRGYVLQVNKGSVLGRLGRRARLTADWILKNGLAHIAASDAHGAAARTPHMTELREFLEENYSPRCAELLLEENPRRVIANEPMY